MVFIRLMAPLFSYGIVLMLAVHLGGRPFEVEAQTNSRAPASCLDYSGNRLDNFSLFQQIGQWPSISQEQWNYYYWLTAIQQQSPFRTDLSFAYLNANPWSTSQFSPPATVDAISSRLSYAAMEGNPWAGMSLPSPKTSGLVQGGAIGSTSAPILATSFRFGTVAATNSGPAGVQSPNLRPVPQSLSSPHFDPMHRDWQTP
jgi:hypothetical protein